MTSLAALVDSGLVTYRQLDHWVRRGYLRPVEASPGSGHDRVWPAAEVAVAGNMARLRAAGFTVEAAAEYARVLDAGPVDLPCGLLLKAVA